MTSTTLLISLICLGIASLTSPSEASIAHSCYTRSQTYGHMCWADDYHTGATVTYTIRYKHTDPENTICCKAHGCSRPVPPSGQSGPGGVPPQCPFPLKMISIGCSVSRLTATLLWRDYSGRERPAVRCMGNPRGTYVRWTYD